MQLGLNKLPWYWQATTFAALGVGIAAVFYNFYAVDMQASIDQREQQLNGLRAEITKAQETAKRLPEFQGEVTELESRLESLRAVLPEQKDVADLLTRIQTLATQSNLTIKGFKPGAVTTKQLHAEWPITLELSGTYHDLGAFFDKVSKVPRIININDIEIKAVQVAPGQAKATSSATVDAKCLATTFVLLENPTAVPGAKPATGKTAATTVPVPGATTGSPSVMAARS
jgi:type IV pilus assembly protein PilO